MAWKSSAPLKQGILVFVLCYVHNLELNEILCILVIQLSSKFRPLNCVPSHLILIKLTCVILCFPADCIDRTVWLTFIKFWLTCL